MLVQIGHAFAVYLHHFQRTGFLHKILRHDAHAWPYFQHRQLRTGIHCVGNGFRNGEIGQEMLTQVFLRSYLFHDVGKGTEKRVNNKIKK